MTAEQQATWKEIAFREALGRIAAGFYTEKGAEQHAKDILRLVDERRADDVSVTTTTEGKS